MAHSVFHRGYEIELNLSEPDLGHPDRPGLLEELYQNYRPDLLYCIDAHEHDGWACPGFMAIRKSSKGRAHAMHVAIGQRVETRAESDLHKALKEHTATIASREGLAVEVEDRSTDGRRRTDVVVTGCEGQRIGYEIQLSGITPRSVDKRTRIARRDGLQPLWTVTDAYAVPINRAHWARVEAFDWKEVTRAELPVRGGVQRLRLRRCDHTSAVPCPDKGVGRCGGFHGNWHVHEVKYDELILKTANAELVPLYYQQSDGKRAWYMWVSPKDKADFLQGRPEPVPPGFAPDLPQSRTDLPTVPRPRDPNCHYREDTGLRSQPVSPRDDGKPIEAAEWVSQSPPDGYLEVQETGGFAIPTDLIEAQRAFYIADQRCAEISAELPRGTDIAAGRAAITEEQRAVKNIADAERIAIVEFMYDHPWWATVKNRLDAKQALRDAARGN